MRNNGKEISDSDDSELIDDPSPVPAENTLADKFIKEKNLNNSTKQSNSIGKEASSDENSGDDLHSSKTSRNKITKKKQKSSLEVTDRAKNKSSENHLQHVKATIDTKDLSSDDEVYIFHCPDNFKKEDLLNKFIDLSKPKQFVNARDGEKYQLQILASEHKQVTLAVPKKSYEGQIFNFPLKGHMVIQKMVEMETNQINDLNEAEDTVIFPDDIKIRHPFLGVNWKSYIDSAKEAIEKSHFVKKMRKKIKKQKIEEIVDVGNKKLKRKSDSEIGSPKKHKKKHFNISLKY